MTNDEEKIKWTTSIHEVYFLFRFKFRNFQTTLRDSLYITYNWINSLNLKFSFKVHDKTSPSWKKLNWEKEDLFHYDYCIRRNQKTSLLSSHLTTHSDPLLSSLRLKLPWFIPCPDSWATRFWEVLLNWTQPTKMTCCPPFSHTECVESQVLFGSILFSTIHKWHHGLRGEGYKIL